MKKINNVLENYLLILILLIVISSIRINSQGSVDMGYIPISYLDSSLIDSKVAMDFKTHITDTIIEKDPDRYFRHYMKTSDTVELYVCNQFAKFVEVWLEYPDHSVIEDQSLKGINANLDLIEFKLIGFDSTSLKIVVKVEKYKKPKYWKDNLKIVYDTISVDKYLLKGIFL